jgi:hypothetical protein
MLKLVVLWLVGVGLGLGAGSDGFLSTEEFAVLCLALAVFCAFAGRAFALEGIVSKFGRRD